MTQSDYDVFIIGGGPGASSALCYLADDGELDAGRSKRWRLQDFYLLVKLQARWPLVPRISLSQTAQVRQPLAESTAAK